jgi:uncharacterized membrane protein
MQTFSKSQAINFGWEKTKKNLAFLVVLQIIWWLIYLLPYGVAQFFILQENAILGAVFSIVDYLLTCLITLGLIKVGLNFVDNKTSSFGDLFTEWRKVLKFLVAMFLYVLIIIVGFLFFIIPGIILMFRLSFFAHLMVDKDMGIIQSLTASATITRGSVWNLFVFNLFFAGVAVIGALFFLIGLFAAYPVIFISSAYAYRRLVDRAEELGFLYIAN